jgi:hypothetical protein
MFVRLNNRWANTGRCASRTARERAGRVISAAIFAKDGARDVSASERQGANAMNVRPIQQSSTLVLVLLGDQQIEEFLAGIPALEDHVLELVAERAQTEIDRREYDREHDPEFAPALFARGAGR